MVPRDQYLANIEFKGCKEVPCQVAFAPATWIKYGSAIEDLINKYPFISDFWPYEQIERGDYHYLPPAYSADEAFADNWGCVWETVYDGLEGLVHVHPLDDWSKLDSYSPPDPLSQDERGPREDWDRTAKEFAAARANNELAVGEAGRFFARLTFLRGYENLLMDLLENRDKVERLMELILYHNTKLIDLLVKAGADVVYSRDDMGTQRGLMVHPDLWREVFAEGYRRLFRAASDRGVHYCFASDGHILAILPDLIDCGASCIQIQVGPNPIEEIARRAKGRVCVAADLDRQQVLPVGTREKIRSHIAEIVKKLGASDGGLIVMADIYPDVSLENIEAMCQAMDEYRYYWADKGMRMQ